MRRSTVLLTCLALCFLTCGTVPAWGAEARITMTVTVDTTKNKVSKCEVNRVDDQPAVSADSHDDIIVQFVKASGGGDAFSNPVVSGLQYEATSTGGVTVALTKSTTATTVELKAGGSPAGTLRDGMLTIKDGGNDACGAPVKLASTTPKGPAAPPGTGAAVYRSKAAEWLRTKCDDACKKELGTHVNRFTNRKHVTILHLPDFEVVSPLPYALSEEDTLVLAIVVPDTMSAQFNIVECTAPSLDRVLGSPAKPLELVKLQALTPPQEVGFHIERYARELRCSGTFRYEITIIDNQGTQVATSGELKQSLKNIYYFSWGVAVGYDFGSPAKISTTEQAKEGGGMETVVKRDRDTTGVKPLISLSLHPCGWNLEERSWCELLSPFIGGDPTRADQGFVAGIDVPIQSYAGIQLGVSVFKSEELKGGVKPGDVIEAGQKPSTREVFNSDGVGFFLGLNFTDKMFQKLFGDSSK